MQVNSVYGNYYTISSLRAKSRQLAHVCTTKGWVQDEISLRYFCLTERLLLRIYWEFFF